MNVSLSSVSDVNRSTEYKKVHRTASKSGPPPLRVHEASAASDPAFMLTIRDDEARWMANAGDKVATTLSKRMSDAIKAGDRDKVNDLAGDVMQTMNEMAAMGASLCPVQQQKNSMSAMLAVDQADSFRDSATSFAKFASAWFDGKRTDIALDKATKALISRTTRFVDFFAALPRPDDGF